MFLNLLTEPWFWFSLSILFLIIEFLGAGALFAIIFAIGASFSGITSFFITNWVPNATIFVVSSILMIFILKPILEKAFQTNKTELKSGVQGLIGAKGNVVTTITKTTKGTVLLNHEDWAAISTENIEIKEGTSVTVDKIEGATLHVSVFTEKEVE